MKYNDSKMMDVSKTTMSTNYNVRQQSIYSGLINVDLKN